MAKKASDRDAEQGADQTNCGARCIAWLLVCKNYGIKTAILI